jgi:hypothetical protein
VATPAIESTTETHEPPEHVEQQDQSAPQDLIELHEHSEPPSVAAAAPTAGVANHLLFVPLDDGYELVERDGAVPEVGATVDFGGQAWVVTKLGRSPLPFDERNCVFLATAL